MLHNAIFLSNLILQEGNDQLMINHGINLTMTIKSGKVVNN